MGENRIGSYPRPASAPRVIGAYGGRHTVVPVLSMVEPLASARTATRLTVSSFPWAGPIVAVVKRLTSSTESNPSAAAARTSFDETSSEKSTIPWVRDRNSGGCVATGSSGTATEDPPPARPAASCPVARPCSTSASSGPSPANPPVASTVG
jgi:hypothetical protein